MVRRVLVHPPWRRRCQAKRVTSSTCIGLAFYFVLAKFGPCYHSREQIQDCRWLFHGLLIRSGLGCIPYLIPRALRLAKEVCFLWIQTNAHRVVEEGVKARSRARPRRLHC